MKGCVLFILILVGQLFGAGAGFACGKEHITKISAVSHRVAHRKAYCAKHRYYGSCNRSKQCDHNCSQSGCDCAHAASAYALKTQPAGLVNTVFDTIDNASSWFFQQPAPKPVYLSLWTPPNIGC